MDLNLKKKQINFIGMRYIALFFTVFLIVMSLLSLMIKGINFGLDFTGGTIIELTYNVQPDLNKIRSQLSIIGYNENIVQSIGNINDVLIRIAGSLSPDKKEVLLKTISNNNHQGTLKSMEYIGPIVGSELRDKGFIGIIVAMIGILIYISVRFKWQFAFSAIFALLHDVIIIIGIFSLFQMTFDLTVLAALLAVIGYSLNDTIIIFDRIRENINFNKITRNIKYNIIEILNFSINQTLFRTIATSFSTLLAIISLLLLGGDNLFCFSIAFFIGIIIGTYSSIYIAPSILILLKKK